MISWFERKSRTNTYEESNLGHDLVEDVSVILWGFSSRRTNNSFDIDAVYQLRLKEIYAEHDSFLSE